MTDGLKIMQSAIGMLTIAHGAMKHVESTGMGLNEEDIRHSVELLRSEVFDFDMAFNLNPGEGLELAQRAVQAAASEFGDRAAYLMGGFLRAFMALAYAYETDCPNADIAGLLQRISIQLESEESDERR